MSCLGRTVRRLMWTPAPGSVLLITHSWTQFSARFEGLWKSAGMHSAHRAGSPCLLEAPRPSPRSLMALSCLERQLGAMGNRVQAKHTIAQAPTSDQEGFSTRKPEQFI